MEEEEEEDDEDEDEDEEELLLLAEVKGVMEGVGVSPVTFCMFDPLLRAPTFHPRTDASSSSVTRRPCGRKCYITPAFSGVPNKGDKIKVGPQVGGDATSPLHSWGSPKKGGQNQNWMPNPCLMGGPQVGRNATSPLHSWGSPKKGGQNQNWMPNPCLLGGP